MWQLGVSESDNRRTVTASFPRSPRTEPRSRPSTYDDRHQPGIARRRRRASALIQGTSTPRSNTGRKGAGPSCWPATSETCEADVVARRRRDGGCRGWRRGRQRRRGRSVALKPAPLAECRGVRDAAGTWARCARPTSGATSCRPSSTECSCGVRSSGPVNVKVALTWDGEVTMFPFLGFNLYMLEPDRGSRPQDLRQQRSTGRLQRLVGQQLRDRRVRRPTPGGPTRSRSAAGRAPTQRGTASDGPLPVVSCSRSLSESWCWNARYGGSDLDAS